ncbi:MAG: hypothetical protein U9P50_02160 [Patescibacteria group bacterium]|nr:hypothetical protein [Patescibacteria group bacterium]
MSEPKYKSSPEWRDWFVRRNFGGVTIAIIKATKSKEALDILVKFIKDIQDK